MKITTIGIDLAKNVFQVPGVEEPGKAVFNKGLQREQVAAWINLYRALGGGWSPGQDLASAAAGAPTK